MREVTLTEAELQMLGAGRVIPAVRSIQARTGLGIREAILEVALQQARGAKPVPEKAPPVEAPAEAKPEAPKRPPPPADDREDELLCPRGVGKPPVEKAPVEKPEPRLLFQAKAGKHNPRVSLSEVEAMTRGEAEKGALAEAIANVTRWGIPLTIQLNTKDRKGHKGSGRRVRISRG